MELDTIPLHRQESIVFLMLTAPAKYECDGPVPDHQLESSEPAPILNLPPTTQVSSLFIMTRWGGPERMGPRPPPWGTIIKILW